MWEEVHRVNPLATKVYLDTDVNTASGGYLILRLYDKAISCLKLGREAMEKANYETSANHLTRVLDIIHELMVSINLDYQPIATNLFSLYSYTSQRVLDASLRNDPAILEEVIRMLKDLRSAWEEAVRKYPDVSAVDEAHLNGHAGPAKAGAM